MAAPIFGPLGLEKSLSIWWFPCTLRKKARRRRAGFCITLRLENITSIDRSPRFWGRQKLSDLLDRDLRQYSCYTPLLRLIAERAAMTCDTPPEPPCPPLNIILQYPPKGGVYGSFTPSPGLALLVAPLFWWLRHQRKITLKKYLKPG